MRRHEEGRDVPEEFYRKKEVAEHLRFYWESFWELGTERQIGMGAGPIPRSAVRDFVLEYDMAGDALDRFVQIIQRMDHEYLDLVNKASKTKDQPHEVDATDIEGVKGVFNRIQARNTSSKRTNKRAH